jgi:hypothetical protein
MWHEGWWINPGDNLREGLINYLLPNTTCGCPAFRYGALCHVKGKVGRRSPLDKRSGAALLFRYAIYIVTE